MTASNGNVTHHAEYYAPGSLFAEESYRELSDRSPDAAMARAPDGVFAFILYDKPVIDFEYDEERFQVLPRRQNVSSRYYIGGELFDRDQVAALGEDYRVLLANMEGNGWDRMIRTPLGNWQPFTDEDTLLTPKGVVHG